MNSHVLRVANRGEREGLGLAAVASLPEKRLFEVLALRVP